MDPIITVIMPVYNTEKYLKDAIDSVINQSFKRWELICVNDGSTDKSLEILRYYESLDERIFVFDQENSGSASAARNVALDRAKGEYVHMLDSDDLLSENCLTYTYERAVSTNADFVVPDLSIFKDNISNIISSLIDFHFNREIVLSPKDAFAASLGWKISGVGLFRTKLVRKYRYDETGMNGDEYTTRLLLLNCNKIAFCSGSYFYRNHSASTTRKFSINRFDTILTDFRILSLAYEYQLNSEVLSLCKKNITANILSSMQFFLGNKNELNPHERKFVEKKMKGYIEKINGKHIENNNGILDYLFNRFIFSRYQIIEIYSLYRFHLIPSLKKCLNFK